MAKILLIISALVIAATAYLGFATKQKVDAMQTDLTDKKKAAQTAQTEAANSKKLQKKAEEDLIAAKADVETKDKEVTAKKAEVDTLTAQVKKGGEDLATATAEIERLKGGPNPVTPNVDVEQLNAKIAELSKATADLEGRVAELAVLQEAASKKVTDANSRATSLETQVQGYKQGYTRQGLTGTITAYNPGWNFVVLNIGDRQSLKVGKEMVVKRGGQMIAKVKVTSVDPGTSIADIIPSTLAKGESVQPGDSVVYEGRSVY